MKYISSTLIENSNKNNLTEFIKQNYKISKPQTTPHSEFLGELISDGIIDADELNEFFFGQLFYGNNRYMHIYKLHSVRHIKDINFWEDRIMDKYNIAIVPFNRIIETHPDDETPIKLAYINFTMSESGNNISKIQLLFAHRFEIYRKMTLSKTFIHIAVEINISEKTLVIRAQKHSNLEETYRVQQLIQGVYDELLSLIGFSIDQIQENHQSILYLMSKDLLNKFLENIPNMRDVEKSTELINSFIKKLPLEFQHTEHINGIDILNPDIMDLQNKIHKILQQAVALDYLTNSASRFNEIVELLDMVICYIKFNDRNNITATISGENRKFAVYNSETFLGVWESIEKVQSVSTLAISIAKQNNDGKLRVKFSALNPDFLTVHILNTRRYDEDEYSSIWRIYKSYE